MRASLACASRALGAQPDTPAKFAASGLAAGRARLACALLGVIGAAVPAVGTAAIKLEVPAGTVINVQPNEIITVRNDAQLVDFASTDRPPLRVTSAVYAGVTLPVTPDLCVTMPDFGQLRFGQTLTLRFADDSGATASLTLVPEQGGGGDEKDCHDPAPPVAGPNHPLVTQTPEDTPLVIQTANLLALLRDPNGGTLTLTNPGVQPANAGTVTLVLVPGAPPAIRYQPAQDFNGAVSITYDVDDTHGDGPVAFAAQVTVTPVNDGPTASDSTCSVGAAGGTCLLNFADVDSPNLSFSIVTPPQGGALGGVNMTTRQIDYAPRPGIASDSFTYEVMDGFDLTARATVSITVTSVAQVPTAAIRLTRTDGTPIANPDNVPDTDAAAGELVRLDGTSSLPGNPSSPIVSYRWTVNNQALAAQTPTVDVRLPDGPSTISLVVQDQLNRSSAPATQQATVAARPNTPSTPRITLDGVVITGSVTVDNEDFEPGETVTFDASGSTDPDGDPIVQYTWRLNAQQVQSGSSPSVTMALRDGANTVELTITDNRGGTGTASFTATVAADTDLGALSGLSGNERGVGTAISELCPRMNELPSQSLTSGQRELLDRCTDILCDEDSNQQRGAVQAITPDQIVSQQTTGIDFSTSQLGNLTSRLVALRGGAGGGLSVAGLSVRDANGNLIPVEQLAALARHLTGGASGDERTSLAAPWGIFVNGNVVDGEKDRTANEEGFDFGGWGITAGFDYRFTDRFVLGLSLGYNEADSDFQGNSGSLDAEGVTTSLYGTYFNDRWYTDFIASAGALDYDSVRHITYNDADSSNDDFARGVTDGDLTTLGASFGYDFVKGGWTFGPTFALTMIEIEVDPFAETGAGASGGLNMAFGAQKAESRTAQGGFQFAYALSREWGVLSPQMRLAFVKEFENDSEILNVRFVNDPFANDPTQPSPGAITILTDDPDEDYLRWSLGVALVRTNGFSAFVDYEGLSGMSTVSSAELTFGLRFERSFE